MMDKQLHFLLADDDSDDRFFFNMALKSLSIPTLFSAVEDGQKLMDYLFQNSKQLPDVLFLDLNMPKKNGSECLDEIKSHEILKDLPVIIYSTSLHENIADQLYKKGAQHYIRKGSLEELEKTLQNVVNLMSETKFTLPKRDQFILSHLVGI